MQNKLYVYIKQTTEGSHPNCYLFTLIWGNLGAVPIGQSRIDSKQPNREGNLLERGAAEYCMCGMLPWESARGGMFGIGMFSAQLDAF